MPQLAATTVERPVVVGSFPSRAGLWDAIVGKLAETDPAGSRLVGSSWPDQPTHREPGMFDIVLPDTDRPVASAN